VGCADRSAYDLTQHTKATGVRLAAEKRLAEPKVVDVTGESPNCYCAFLFIDASFEVCIQRLLPKHTVSEYGNSVGRGCRCRGVPRGIRGPKGGKYQATEKLHSEESHKLYLRLSSLG